MSFLFLGFGITQKLLDEFIQDLEGGWGQLRKNPLNFTPDPEEGQFKELLVRVALFCYFMLFQHQL